MVSTSVYGWEGSELLLATKPNAIDRIVLVYSQLRTVYIRLHLLRFR
jgi:hypothetical protein